MRSTRRVGILESAPEHKPSNHRWVSEQTRRAQAKGKPWLMKCWELPDWAFVSAIRTVQILRAREDYSAAIPASIWDVTAVIAGHPEDVVTNLSTQQEYPGVPPKLMLAKAKGLIKRGIIDGCACGCRGDFEVVDA